MASDSSSPMVDYINRNVSKQFFTRSEWHLIYSLVRNNAAFCEDTEDDPMITYTNIEKKIKSLFE